MTHLEDQVAAVLRPIVASLYVDSDRHAEITAEVIALVAGAIADKLQEMADNAAMAAALYGDHDETRIYSEGVADTAEAAIRVVRGSVSPPLAPTTTEGGAM